MTYDAYTQDRLARMQAPVTAKIVRAWVTRIDVNLGEDAPWRGRIAMRATITRDDGSTADVTLALTPEEDTALDALLNRIALRILREDRLEATEG
jgi:hypothetical protein